MLIVIVCSREFLQVSPDDVLHTYQHPNRVSTGKTFWWILPFGAAPFVKASILMTER